GAPEWASCAVQPVVNDACPQLLAWSNGDPLTDEQRRAASADPICDTRSLLGTTSTQVADGDALATLTGASGDDLSRAQQTLADGGVVVRSPLLITDGEVTLAVIRPDPEADLDAIAD